MISEYLIKKALDAAIEIGKKILKESDSELSITRENIEESISIHLRSVEIWSREVLFSDLNKAKGTANIFIDLNLFVYPRRLRFQVNQAIKAIPLKDIFSFGNHFVLLGQPGAGKTTSMRYLCQGLLCDTEFPGDRFYLPLVIRLRDLNNTEATFGSTLITEKIFNILGLKVHFLQKELRSVITNQLLESLTVNQIKTIKQKLVFNFLNQLQVLLILDGFDELTLVNTREEVIEDIRSLVSNLDRSTLIITSRTGDFIYSIDNTVQYELCPLTEDQILTFAKKWLNDEEKASDFMAKVCDSPFADTAMRPLTLAHLCAIYEREDRIPDKPKSIYRKVINLLLEEWDRQRSVKRYSRYAKFEADRKFEFLCHLAFSLTAWLQKTVFSDQDLFQAYNKIHNEYGLTSNEAEQVICEIETHNGLFLQSGYESFEFAHKSLQEYLTAEYLVRLPSIPVYIHILIRLPNELAIAVAISSRPNLYFSELINNRFLGQDVSKDFLKAFLSRLLLEKPDFNFTPQLCLSLITFYTLYAEHNIGLEDQVRPFYKERVIKDLERLIAEALSEDSIKVINSLYEPQCIYPTEDGDSLHQFIEKKHVRSIESFVLSKSLYLRNSWLVRPN
jgi:hypothetical protein